MVAGGPSPGMIPTIVPRSTPTKHHSWFAGCAATAGEGKYGVKRRRGENPGERRDPEPPPVHHRGDEEGQRGEAQQETRHLESRDRDHERGPGGERTARTGPVDGFFAGCSQTRNHQQKRERDHRDAVPERKEPWPRAVGTEVFPARCLENDVRAQAAERQAGPEVGLRHLHRFALGFVFSFLYRHFGTSSQTVPPGARNFTGITPGSLMTSQP